MKKHLIIALLLSNIVLASTNYVNLLSTNPAFPYTSWETAAKNIQTAINAADKGNMVLVTNGTYYHSSKLIITNEIVLKSFNGLGTTIIDGSNSHQCCCLKANNTITGFVITNGFSLNNSGGYIENGAGVHLSGGGIVSNCLIVGNTIDGMYGTGGGVYNSGGLVIDCEIRNNVSDLHGAGVLVSDGTIERCIIHHNVDTFYSGGGIDAWNSSVIMSCLIYSNSSYNGGGIRLESNSKIYNCTIVDNSASNQGGGIYSDMGGNAEIFNSIIYNNNSQNYQTPGGSTFVFSYCCTIPKPVNNGNIDNDPQFVSAFDFHLKSTSPCKDSGTNIFYVYTSKDLDGNNRLRGAKVDMGAYEAIPEPAVIFTFIYFVLFLKTKMVD